MNATTRQSHYKDVHYSYQLLTSLNEKTDML